MTTEQNNHPEGLMGKLRLPIGSPIILRNTKSPYEVGGFIERINAQTITLSYSNPRFPVNVQAFIALTLGNRTYRLEKFNDHQDINDFEKFLKGKIPETEEPFKTTNGINAAIGDFIALKYNQQSIICGFIKEMDFNSIKLSHENPLQELPPSEVIRAEVTKGNRTFKLDYFTNYQIIKPLAQQEP